jgi:Ca2+-binding RTX toxin-like protein
MLVGNGEPQRMTGSAGADTLMGEGGADELHGNVGNDGLGGGDGNDTLYGDEDDDGLAGGPGNDELHGGNSQDNLDGGMGDDAMYGELGDDWFEGGAVANGADLISCGTGGDSPETHPWYDTVAYFSGNIYNGRTVALYVNPDGIANDGQDADFNKVGEEGDNVMPDCEQVWGGKANDFFEGTSGQDRFIGMEGNDGFRSNGGFDQLEGREGDDVFLAKDGQQQYLSGGDGNDVAQYDEGLDTLFTIP